MIECFYYVIKVDTERRDNKGDRVLSANSSHSSHSSQLLLMNEFQE